MSKPPRDYTVGYGKPPKLKQFPKGQSGNPKGSSKKARNKTTSPYDTTIASIWREEGEKKIDLTVNGETERIALMRAATRRLLYDAVAGKPAAQRLVHAYGLRCEKDRREMQREMLQDAAKAQDKARSELESRVAAGEKDPVVIPHPDDFVCNPATGDISIVGPTTLSAHEAMLENIKLRQTFLEYANMQDLGPQARIFHLRKANQMNQTLPPRLRTTIPKI